MCIRDSISTVRSTRPASAISCVTMMMVIPSLALIHILNGVYTAMYGINVIGYPIAFIPYIAVSVSYTHLDVYKRQHEMDGL